MVKKILFWLFLFVLLTTVLGKPSFFIELLIYGGYKMFKHLKSKTELELILDTYNDEDEVKGNVAITKKAFYLEKKLKSLPNKNGAIQFKKLTAMTQNFT